MSDTLDKVLPPRETIYNPFTGEVIDRDDLPAIKAALKELSVFLDEEVWRKYERHFKVQREMRARIGELEPTTLPARRNMSRAQERLAECPRCRTRIPRVVVADEEDND